MNWIPRAHRIRPLDRFSTTLLATCLLLFAASLAEAEASRIVAPGDEVRVELPASAEGAETAMVTWPTGSVQIESDALVYTATGEPGTDAFTYVHHAGGRLVEESVTLHVRPARAWVVGDRDCDGSVDYSFVDTYRSAIALCLPVDGDDLSCTWHDLPLTGIAGWTVLTGDWNADGCSELAYYDPASGRTLLEEKEWRKGRTKAGIESSRLHVVQGPAGARPFALDVAGTGHDRIGYYQPETASLWMPRATSDGFDTKVLGQPGNGQPATFDWNGDGQIDLGIYDPESGRLSVLRSPGSTTFERTFQLRPGHRAVSWPVTSRPSFGLVDPQIGNLLWFGPVTFGQMEKAESDQEPQESAPAAPPDDADPTWERCDGGAMECGEGGL